MKDGSGILASLIADHDRAQAALGKLRQDLATLREENDRLRKERSEILNGIAAGLDTASDALRRFRDAPAVIPVDPITAAGAASMVVPAPAGDAVVTTPALPSATTPVETPAPKEPREPDPWRILVVDDDTSFRDLLALHLGNQGHEVRSAASGEEALMLLADYQPQVILLDLRMPGMDGMETLRRIKAIYPGLRVLMITADGDRTIAQEALALGAADYMNKPLTLDYLDAVLHIYMTNSDAPGTAPPAMTPVGASQIMGPPTSPPTRGPFARR
jgi:CheY-like chemotaxis protein